MWKVIGLIVFLALTLGAVSRIDTGRLYFINVSAVTPEGLNITWVDVDPMALFPGRPIEIVAVDGWLEPFYLRQGDSGHTKLFVRLKPSNVPITDYDAHTNNDPSIVAILSLAVGASNLYGQRTDTPPLIPPLPTITVPANVQITLPIQFVSREGVIVAREDARWVPPGQFFITEPISLGFTTSNPGALLHGRVWVRTH